jgi:hypothetical protein
MSTGKLWCGKASAIDCLSTLLLAISNQTYTNFPKLVALTKFNEFIQTDKSHRFEKRTETLEAPPNTGKIPLESANVTLLVKLFVNRLDAACIEYFHSTKSTEWKPRNKYGEELLVAWTTFNKEFITETIEYIKVQKTPEEKKVEHIKSILPKTQGVWGQRLFQKLTEIEKTVNELKMKATVAESVPVTQQQDTDESDDESVEEPVVEQKTKPVNDGEGEWISVGKKKKPQQKFQKKPPQLNK